MLYLPGTKTGVILTDRELALINTLRIVFPRVPRLLCIWHVEKDVQRQAKKVFENSDDSTAFLRAWTTLINSSSYELYNENWNKLKDTYNVQVPGLVQYVKETWLNNFKLSLVKTYADLHPHYGNRTTSRVEGGHAVLKRYLQVSTGDLRMVFDKITILLENQHAEFDGNLANDQIKTPHYARHPLFGQLLSRVSNYALGQIWGQRYRLIKGEPLPLCTFKYTMAMGLPCAHKIQARLAETGVLTIDNIHSHWHFNPPPIGQAIPLILEPAMAQVRGRPTTQQDVNQARPLNQAARSRLAASSTQREPSAFERPNIPVRARTRSGLRSARSQQQDLEMLHS